MTHSIDQGVLQVTPTTRFLEALGVAAGRRRVLKVALIIAACELMMVGSPLVLGLIEWRYALDPVWISALSWVAWTFWHSYLFPIRRERHLRESEHPYRSAFYTDIFPGVCFGFAQMWRPLFNGDNFQHWASEPQPAFGSAQLAIGTVVCVSSVVFIIQAMRVVGIHNAAFVPEFIDHQEFEPIRSGIYGVIRHPLFWGGVGYSVGLALVAATRSAYVIATINVSYGVLYNWLEDRRLRSVFGTRYSAYSDQVPAILPLARLYQRLSSRIRGRAS